MTIKIVLKISLARLRAVLINGKKIAAQIEARLAKEIRTRKVRPHLAVVLVGNNPASRVYVGKKGEAAGRVGIDFSLHELSQPSLGEILILIDRLNTDRKVTGIIVQLPLPKNLDEELIINHISPDKDVDGLNPFSRFTPATAGAVLEVLHRQRIKIAGARAVVVGRGKVAGRPIALALLANDATVTIAHSKTRDLVEITKQADILVSAVGRPGMIKPVMVKKGAAVVDVGISRVDGKLRGDVDPAVEKKARFLTPVPGGIGPLTVVKLLENVFLSWKSQNTR
ncbi:MAG TPA: bifunctional 5,10-methylenetetrahydrofolate dehydrogenase/5,10-methenyltetrahydrofolate cyclohydrolase [Patescibacteria group bacterium]|nr:bifunctional 5,10-methylenetetrahydrofolate dehydrogenase/5,10-methenyltetrahydrofolate cyclohydrolase [Patescibacteria group bacterium]